MNNDPLPRSSTSRIAPVQWVFLGAVLALFVVLRLSWLDHLLTWDEAMTLCSVRAFAARAYDYYSQWFWRRPPLFGTLLLLLRPLADGLAVRAALLAVLLSAAGCALLFLVNARVFGPAPALWSCFFIAVMPGAVFYDVWIKQDALVIVFGLLMIYFFLLRRPVLSGVCLALGLLGKELAVFYAGAVFILWLLQDRSARRVRDLVVIYGVGLLLSAWWYVLFSNSVRAVLRFLRREGGLESEVWLRPWYYFFDKMRFDLEWWGIVLALAGVLALLLLARARRRGDESGVRDPAVLVWPLALLIPSYLLISLMPAKTPWFTTSLFPALATLQGVGAWWLLRRLGGSEGKGWRRTLAAGVGVLAIAGTLSRRAGADFERGLEEREWGLYWGSAASRAAALRLNELVKEGDTVLITPMFYWQVPRQIPCPIFVHYLKKDIPVIVRRNDIPLDALLESIRKYEVDWALVSPEMGIGEKEIIHPLMKDYGLYPMQVGGACIFKTDSIRDLEPEPKPRRWFWPFGRQGKGEDEAQSS